MTPLSRGFGCRSDPAAAGSFPFNFPFLSVWAEQGGAALPEPGGFKNDSASPLLQLPQQPLSRARRSQSGRLILVLVAVRLPAPLSR